MKNILSLRIYTPQKLFIEEKITKISVSGDEGNYTILPKHLDYLSSFGRSVINFEKITGERVYVWLSQGILVKCGREIQISVFNVLESGGSALDLKKKLESSQKNTKSVIESSKKFKITLKNIEGRIAKIM